MKKFKVLTLTMVLAGSMVSQPLWADTTTNTADLEQRLDNLEQQVAELKQELQEQKAQSTNTQAISKTNQPTVPQGTNSPVNVNQPAPVVTATKHIQESAAIGNGGFSIQSPNGDYKLKIGGYVDVDAREFGDNKKDLGYSSSILARHINPIIQGTVARDFDYFFQADLGYNNAYSTVGAANTSTYAPSIVDAYMEYKYLPWAKIRAGKFKVPFDIENLQDVARFSNFAELGLTSNLSPLRDTGVQVGGNVLKDRLNYAVGIFGGAADRENYFGGNSTAGADNNNRDVAGRIFVQPFKGNEDLSYLSGLGVGYAATYGKEKGTDLPTYISPGQAPVFTYNSGVTADGPQLRRSPQFDYYYKSFGLIGEYVDDDETLEYKNGASVIKDKVDNSAWQLTGSYVLTGENASYWGVTPKNNFDLSNGTWGAFELAGRYGQLFLDHDAFDQAFANPNTSISDEKAWALGLNWYLNTNVKIVFDFEQTKFKRGAVVASNDGDRKTENLFTTRFQLSL